MQPIFEPLVRRLRGRHNSVRHRFIKLPIAWAEYAYSRAIGRSWTDHYRIMVDRSARATDLSDPCVANSIEDGAMWLPIFRKHNLRPDSQFLDLGCGRCRMGAHLIPLLTSGRYVGADISRATMDNGVKILSQRGIGPERYELLWVKDNRLLVLEDRMFDFGMAWSVITHLELSEIEVLFRSLRRHIKPGGKFFFSFTISDKLNRENLKDFGQPVAVIERIVRDAGFDFSVEADWNSGWENDRVGIAYVPR